MLNFPSIKGASRSGKTASVKLASSILGKYLHTWDCMENGSVDSILEQISGSCNNGFWFLLKNVDKLNSEVATIVSKFILDIRERLTGKIYQVNSVG